MQFSISRVLALLLITSTPLTLASVDVKDSRDGFSLEENQAYAGAAGYRQLLGGGEITSWWSQNISRTMRTAVIPNRLPASTFKRNEGDWARKLGELSAETDLGRTTLSEVINDPRSATKAIIVLYRGEVVYEAYPGLRPADSHFWASGPSQPQRC